MIMQTEMRISMNINELIENPALENIDKDKLNALLLLANQAGSKNNDELLPFILSSFSKENGLDFNDEETGIILEVLKTKMSPKEIKKIETLRNLSRIINSRARKMNSSTTN